MAWEFVTEPEFQEKLDWVDAFVRDECEPLDLLFPRPPFDPLDGVGRRSSSRCRRRCRQQGLWACHLGPELGGQGYGQVKLALMNEILGRSPWAPMVFGDPGARHRQRRDPRPLRHRGAEGALPAAAAQRRHRLLASR